MLISLFLAKVIGLFGAISTIAILSRYNFHLDIEEDSAKSPTLIVLSGFFFLLSGITLTVAHPVWVFDWRLIITILGWLVLLKGAMRIFAPDIVKKMIGKKKTKKGFIAGEVISLLISLYLIYKGFFDTHC
jgi:hypothetical protein